MISSYRHFERSREIFLALRSLSHWHWQGNDALVLRISAFSHPSFIGLQRRFLASLEMTIQESHQSLVPGYSPLLSNFWRYPFPVSSSRAQPRDLSCTAVTVTLALAGKRRLVASYFCFLTPIIYRSAKKISRFARNDNTRESPVISPWLFTPTFKLLAVSISRIVIPSAAEGSFLHCGHCHIGTGRETTPWCFVFLLSHILHLSLCKGDFSLRLK